MSAPTPGVRDLPSLDGCRWCGVPQGEHMQRWKPPVGWHTWTSPTDAQRLDRMLARRAARLTGQQPG